MILPDEILVHVYKACELQYPNVVKYKANTCPFWVKISILY